MMDIIIKIFFVLTMLHVDDAKEWKPEKYAEGDDAPIRIDELNINGDEGLEINFSGFFSKQPISNVMLYYPMKMQSDSQSVNRNYTSRIRYIKMDKGCFSFLLLQVNWMDSGNYTVFQNSLEKGKTSILVPRRVLFRHDVGSVILPFMCNKANMSWIKIEMINPTPLAVVIYDVKQEHCTQIGDLYLNRIESCVLNASNFTFTLQNVSWLDKGTYVAWDDRRFLLDSIDLDIQEGTKVSSPEASKVYITLPSTTTEPADSSKAEKGRDLTTHTQADNANMYINDRQTKENVRLEIDLSRYSVKLHVTHLMLSDPMNDQHDGGSVSRIYTGQIHLIVIDKGSLCFQLLHAAFEDRNEFEKSCEKGNGSIIVKRSRLVQQGEESGRPLCMYNETDILSNTNDMIQTYAIPPVISYYVTDGNPTDVVPSYAPRIKNCVFSGNKVTFIFHESSWLERAKFTACDDNGLILHSIFIDVQDSSLKASQVYYKLSTWPTSTHGSYSSNELLDKLVFAGIVAAVTVPLSVAITFLILRCGIFQFCRMEQGKESNEDEITCDEQDIRMGTDSNNTVQRQNAYERDYQQLHSHMIELSAYSQHTGIENDSTEHHSPGASSNNLYEDLHGYENQGNNTYLTLTPEHSCLHRSQAHASFVQEIEMVHI